MGGWVGTNTAKSFIIWLAILPSPPFQSGKFQCNDDKGTDRESDTHTHTDGIGLMDWRQAKGPVISAALGPNDTPGEAHYQIFSPYLSLSLLH